MIGGRRVLAVVPARSGSKGIPDKNMQPLGGVSLIGRAGDTLAACPWIDARLLSTDSERYAEEGRRHGLDAPFLRPDALSGDAAGAVETLQHALTAAEDHYGARFDVVLIVEPTSPLRTPEDLEACARLLVEGDADSVVAVSPLESKSHPRKILVQRDGRLGFFAADGGSVTGRQQLEDGYYYRNGICYALTRRCLMERGAILTETTLPYVVHRPVVNIDHPLELRWAELLLADARSG